MDILTTGASLAVVMGLVQLFKVVAGDSRLAPILALLFGIGIAFLTVADPTHTIREVILQGIINGLSAAGLYSGAKAVIRPAPSTDPIA